MRIFFILTFSLISLTEAALSQEWQGGYPPLPADAQYQNVPLVNRLPVTQPNPHGAYLPQHQFPPPPNDQLQPPPVGGAFQPPPVNEIPLPTPILQEPVPLPAGSSPDQLPEATVAPLVEPPPKIWEVGFELGLDGSEGNSQAFNLHLGANVKRKTEFNILTSELDYKKNSSNSIETVNKAFLDSRFEHIIQESRWTCFVHNIEDYDEFKAYDLRVSLDIGVGYQFLKSDAFFLTGRMGGGATREIGGLDDRYIPEAVFGLEGEYQINKRQKLSASVEYRPEVADFENYRLISKAAWEVLLDEVNHLSMKASILDRYDSYSDGQKPNDLDYTLMLLWKF